MDLLEAVFLVGAAFLAATISGSIGMAGGTLLMVALILVGMVPTVAVPVHAAVQLVSNGTRTWAFRHDVKWPAFFVLAIAALPGPLLGLYLLYTLDADVTRMLLGAFVLYAVWAPKGGLERLPIPAAFTLAGAVAGVLGLVVGAVGPLVAPFFLRNEFSKSEIVATKAVSQGYVHVLKLIALGGFYPHAGYAYESTTMSHDVWVLILPMAAITILGTYAGRAIHRRFNAEQFVRAYRLVLTVLAVRLLLSPWV